MPPKSSLRIGRKNSAAIAGAEAALSRSSSRGSKPSGVRFTATAINVKTGNPVTSEVSLPEGHKKELKASSLAHPKSAPTEDDVDPDTLHIEAGKEREAAAKATKDAGLEPIANVHGTLANKKPEIEKLEAKIKEDEANVIELKKQLGEKEAELKKISAPAKQRGGGSKEDLEKVIADLKEEIGRLELEIARNTSRLRVMKSEYEKGAKMASSKPASEPEPVPAPEPTPAPEPVPAPPAPAPEPAPESESEPVPAPPADEDAQQPQPAVLPCEKNSPALRKKTNSRVRTDLAANTKGPKPVTSYMENALNIYTDIYYLGESYPVEDIRAAPKNLTRFLAEYGINPDHGADIATLIKAFYFVFPGRTKDGKPRDQHPNAEESFFGSMQQKLKDKICSESKPTTIEAPKPPFDLSTAPAFQLICGYLNHRIFTMRAEMTLYNRNDLRRAELKRQADAIDALLSKNKCHAMSSEEAYRKFTQGIGADAVADAPAPVAVPDPNPKLDFIIRLLKGILGTTIDCDEVARIAATLKESGDASSFDVRGMLSMLYATRGISCPPATKAHPKSNALEQLVEKAAEAMNQIPINEEAVEEAAVALGGSAGELLRSLLKYKKGESPVSDTQTKLEAQIAELKRMMEDVDINKIRAQLAAIANKAGAPAAAPGISPSDEIARLTAELESGKQAAAALNAQFAAARTATEAQIATLTDQVARLTAELARLTAEAASAGTKPNADLQAARDEVRRLQAEIARLTAEAEASAAEASTATAEAIEALERAKAEVARLTAELASGTESIADLEAKLAAANAQIAQLTTLNETLNGRLRTLTEQLTRGGDQSVIIQQLQESISGLTTDNTDLRRALEETVTLAESLQGERDQARTELAALRAQLTELQARLAAAEAAARATGGSQAGELIRLRAQLAETTGMRRRIAELEGVVRELNATAQGAAAKAAEAEQRAQAAEADARAGRGAQAQVVQARAQAAQAQAEVVQARAQAAQAQAEAAAARAAAAQGAGSKQQIRILCKFIGDKTLEYTREIPTLYNKLIQWLATLSSTQITELITDINELIIILNTTVKSRYSGRVPAGIEKNVDTDIFKSMNKGRYVELVTYIRNIFVPIKLFGEGGFPYPKTKFVKLSTEADLRAYNEFNKYEKSYLAINQYTVPRYILNVPPQIAGELPSDKGAAYKRTENNKYLRFFFDRKAPTGTVAADLIVPSEDDYNSIIRETLFFYVPSYDRAMTSADVVDQESPWTSKFITGNTQIATAYSIRSLDPLRSQPISSTPNVNRTLLEIILHIAIAKYIEINNLC